MRSVTRIGKGQPSGINKEKRISRKRNVCTALEERVGLKPMPKLWMLPQSSTVMPARRREGVIWN